MRHSFTFLLLFNFYFMSNYTWVYEKKKKLSKNVTQMAHVKVFNDKGKQIGCEAVAEYHTPEKVVEIIVREYSLRKHFNTKIKKHETNT